MCTAISTSALRLIPTLLAAVLLLLFSNCVIAERFQNSTVVPPDQIRSQCSVGLINKISIDVTVTNGPGLDGVYVLDFENYTKLANQFANTTTNKPDLRLASSADQTSSLFNYYIKPSCVADDKRITWCDNGIAAT
ncbi:hypothetical protein BDF19DRAFT_414647 [Syncephalis fuscata]|nr:hypothetical protein BDF19DRAFT_414647 [Syncephalis fuscata]